MMIDRSNHVENLVVFPPSNNSNTWIGFASDQLAA
jgi:hypothetical protein